MQHAVEGEVVDEGLPAGHLGDGVELGQGAAQQGIERRVLGRHRAGRLALQGAAAGELPIAHLLVGRRAAHGAVLDLQAVGVDAEMIGGHIDQLGPRLCRHLMHGAARVLHRARARGDALVDHLAGDAADDAYAVHRHVQFLGGDHGDGGADALADFDLAGLDGDGAVALDGDPAGDPGVFLQAAGKGLCIPVHR